MGGRLNIEINDVDGVSSVKLAGVIDEDNDLSSIPDRIKHQTVLIHAADVERINSCGVRDWVTWLGELDKKGCSLFFIECSPAIMTQVNLVNNFLGTGQIVSFYAPYFRECSEPSCQSDKMLLINVEDAVKDKPFRAPTCRCDRCDHTMEFDDIESSYFAFLNNVHAPQIQTTLATTIKKVSDGASGSLRQRTSSMPMPSLAALNSTPSVPSMPTTPSSRELKGLLTDATGIQTHAGPETAKPSGASSKLLYIIVGLLAVAIGLLTYVVLKRS
ncbi:MAG: hypothetical protein KC503_22580 [Myxococcales bacterium]|nr:hypothetical protein [Myxococcales bacterium]